VYNDEIDAVTLLKQLHQGLYHNIVISPGPGTPTAASDIGLCLALIKAAPPIPILGVCLGFQALALAYGASILRASEPVHGRLSAIRHSGTHPLFFEIPSGRSYQVVRYHSLIVDESTLPEELEAIAWTAPGGHHALGLDSSVINGKVDGNDGDDEGSGVAESTSGGGEGVLMGLAHKSLPYYGVQYHPESIGTAYGHELLKNFKELTLSYYHNQLPTLQQQETIASNGISLNGISTHITTTSAAADVVDVGIKKLDIKLPKQQQTKQQVLPLEVHFREVTGVLSQHGQNNHSKINAQTLFDSIVLENNNSLLLEDTFWLDTAAVDRGRFSFMGRQGGALWRRISYKLLTNNSRKSLDTLSKDAQFFKNEDMDSVPMSPTARKSGGILTMIDSSGKSTSTVESSIWDWLNGELQRWKVQNSIALEVESSSSSLTSSESLPFDFCGGLVGYLGYELKADGCGGKTVHTAPTPDASFFLVDQFIALDHKTGSVYAVAVHASDDSDDGETARQWVDTTAAQIKHLQEENISANGNTTPAPVSSKPPSQSPSPPFVLREHKAHYIRNVESCMEALYAGDSYELCLTTEMRRPSTWGAAEAWTLYKKLRTINPAPYAAWLHFHGEGGSGSGSDRSPLSICCSSPERFLKGDKTGGLEAKPIKGTAPRSPTATPEEDAAAAAALAASEKDRAENLMIVDLLRNDLGRVCDPGTVHVPALMNIESFATVHQLVSTVRGHRRNDASVADAVRAAFPGGSMTGAPKVRSMDIIDQLENGPRGVYSGSLGYFSFNGTFDLNIVIRTAVVHDGAVRIGAGGAIVVQSESEAEYEEMQLKAAALLRAVAQCDSETSA
jgi:para-aminobenzoate synthetase